MTDAELNALHRGAREERRRLTPDPEPNLPPTADLPEHDCLEHLEALDGETDALPPHIVKYECRICGEWYDFDTETGTHEVDR